ncbi:hypothetical protein [Streptomyces sp. NPDC019890]
MTAQAAAIGPFTAAADAGLSPELSAVAAAFPVQAALGRMLA